jgi:hypothetical protein
MTWEPIKPVAPVKNTRMKDLLVDEGRIAMFETLLK